MDSFHYMQVKESIPFEKYSQLSLYVSLIKLWGKVLESVGKTSADKMDARNPLDFS